MAEGYRSLITGRCVASFEEVTDGYCVGYPKLSYDAQGVSTLQTCQVWALPDGPYASITWEVSVRQGGSFFDSQTETLYASACELPVSPWELSVDDGVLVAGAIVAVWLSAWAWRAVRSALV